MPSPTEDLEVYPDRVASEFAGQTVLITGATGFVGKVFLEKLLRSCPGVKKIYVLARTKKDKTPNDRLREIFNGPLYDLLRKQCGETVFDKVEAVSADVAAPDLGLAHRDREKIIEEVCLVYHFAATVRFDESLRKAVFINVRGTKLMVDLAKQCKNLRGFCHLSTAYCHLNERVLYEKPYPPPADPHKVIKACEWLDEEILNTITDKILGDIPNTYAFTKALAEAIIDEEMDKYPIGYVRPSVIIPIWKEPLPGWTDNLNGPTGLLIGAGKGVLRTMHIKADCYADYVPVDIIANCLLCVPFAYKQTGKKISNFTSSAEYQVSFEEIIEMGRAIIEKKLPLNWVVWYPGGSMKKSRLLHIIHFFFSQLLPAIFLDAFLILLGYKPVLMRVQRRIWKGYEIFEYYTTKQWDFDNKHSMELRDMFNPRERATYKLDGDGVNYEEYFTNCVRAGRLYLLKEPDDTIPMAKSHMRRMWYVDKICKIFLTLGMFYMLYKYLIFPLIQA